MGIMFFFVSFPVLAKTSPFSLLHVIVGLGLPLAMQETSRLSPSSRRMRCFVANMTGGTKILLENSFWTKEGEQLNYKRWTNTEYSTSSINRL